MLNKIYFDSETWPKLGFVPEALFRITQEELEKRLCFSFAQFVEEGEEAAGFCAETDSGSSFAIIFMVNRDKSPSLYLPAGDLKNPDVLTQVLAAIGVTRGEIVYGYQSGFSVQDLQAGKHLLWPDCSQPTPAEPSHPIALRSLLSFKQTKSLSQPHSR